MNNKIKCEKCGSELILSHFAYNECCECGETFLNGLEEWFFNASY